MTSTAEPNLRLQAEYSSALAGSVEELLDIYDRDRRVLPPPVRMWEFGWTKSAEVLNGRIAMVGGRHNQIQHTIKASFRNLKIVVLRHRYLRG